MPRPITHLQLDHMDQVMALALVTIAQNILWWILEVYLPLSWDIPTLQLGPQGLDTQSLHQAT